MITLKPVPADSSDLEDLRILYESSFPDNERVPWFRLLQMRKENGRLCACYEKDRLLGMTYAFLHRDTVYFAYLAVRSDLRNKGIGTKILRRFTEEYQGFRIVGDIEVVSENAPDRELRKKRREFYMREGYQSCGFLCYFYFVEYEILSYGGLITPQEWKELIACNWNSTISKFMRIRPIEDASARIPKTFQNSRCLAVPVNETGIKECGFGRFDTENIRVVDLSEEEFSSLLKSGVFAEINRTCALEIDDFREETIPCAKAQQCLDCLKNHGLDRNSVFASSLRLAMRYQTMAFCWF